jgi:UDP-galactopyranose mutase
LQIWQDDIHDYPAAYKDGMESYYTVNDSRINKLAEKYRELALLENNVIFGGRLADYQYYDMDDIVETVLNLNI